MKTVEEAKEMLDREGYKMLDIRPFKAYDREHLTKPPQCTVSTPDPEDGAKKLIERVENQGFRPYSGRLLVADSTATPSRGGGCAVRGWAHRGGRRRGRAQRLAQNPPPGRRRPLQGKWVSTGKGGESPKSGLTGSQRRAAYEENWGKAPPNHGETAESGEEGCRGDSGWRAPAAPAGKRPDGFTNAERPDVVLQPLAMDARLSPNAAAEERGHKVAYSNTISGGEGGEWGSDWDTYYTEDESRTPYYVNRVTGTTQWEQPRRWWSNGKWIDAK